MVCTSKRKTGCAARNEKETGPQSDAAYGLSIVSPDIEMRCLNTLLNCQFISVGDIF